MEHVKLSLDSYESLKADSRELGQIKHVENQMTADLMQAIIDVNMVFGVMMRDTASDKMGMPVVGDAAMAMEAYNRHPGSKFMIRLDGTKLQVSRKKQV